MALGPRPEGDPGGMQRLAGQISAAKGKLHALPDIRFDAWQSPRAQQARGEIQAHVRSADAAEGLLSDAVALLKSEAAELKARQDKWDRDKAAEDAARAVKEAAEKAADAVRDLARSVGL